MKQKFSIALALKRVCQCFFPVVSVNAEGIDKCSNCGHPYPDKKDGKEWQEVASEGHPEQYQAYGERGKDLNRCIALYDKGDIEGAAKCRQKMEKPHIPLSGLRHLNLMKKKK